MLPELRQLHADLTTCLHTQVLPFWFKHGVDPSGGICTCLDDDGRRLSGDKWLWSQWRAVWIFSRLYRRTGERQHLELARHIYEFCSKYGWDEQAAGWRLCVSAEGVALKGHESLYVDGFAMYALAEFIEVTSDETAIGWARKTAESVELMLRKPHDRIPSYPYPTPTGMRAHGLPMIFSLSFLALSVALDDPAYQKVSCSLSDEVFERFYRPDRDLVIERINADGTEGTGPLGTTVVPGHVIESMWFQIDVALRNRRADRVVHAVKLIRRHLEVGWDDRYGGLLLAVDADGRKDVCWPYASYKLWWPHTEAMYALIRAYELTGEAWCLEWYHRVHQYAFSHFPHPTAGEWIQRLDETGNPTKEVVALPVKDPFHLPRTLLLSLESLERMMAADRVPVVGAASASH